MCDCISYNQPKPHQHTPEVVLFVPTWISKDRKTVCVDSCISDAVQYLWKHRVWTLGSCCGHGDATKRSVIVERENRELAEKLLSDFDRSISVGAWELVYSDPASA